MMAEFIINHLWQSSCFALLAAVLALMLRGNSPKVRYWVWLSASLKFLVPWVLLVSLGSMVPRPRHPVAPVATSTLPDTLVQVVEPFSPNAYAAVRAQTQWGVTSLAFFWAAGLIAIAFKRCRSWYGIQAMLRAGSPIKLPIAVPALITATAHEPGVVGFLKPVLVLPDLLLERLNPKQLEALLAHELSHVRRRDNFFAALHMGVETIFWFHPLVWWIGSRLLEERELACDEEVLRLGCAPADYVRGILTVCELYSEGPLACVSGVTGTDIKKRLKAILRGTLPRELNPRKKLALAFAAFAVIAVPVGFGVWSAPTAHAQSAAQQAPGPSFEVASVRPNTGGQPGLFVHASSGGRLSLENYPLAMLIGIAWDIKDFQIVGGPSWIRSDGYNIDAKGGDSSFNFERMRRPLQTLLEERFRLSLHYETRQAPVYQMLVGKSGLKLAAPKDGGCIPPDPRNPGPPPAGKLFCGGLRMGKGRMAGAGISTSLLAGALSDILGRQVTNRTGFNGTFDFTLEFAPDESIASAVVGGRLGQGASSVDASPSIFIALQEQLGIRLEAAKGPVEMLVIDHVERPSDN